MVPKGQVPDFLHWVGWSLSFFANPLTSVATYSKSGLYVPLHQKGPRPGSMCVTVFADVFFSLLFLSS